jgi:hypothetical protein
MDGLWNIWQAHPNRRQEASKKMEGRGGKGGTSGL